MSVLVKFLLYILGCLLVVAIVAAGPATWWMDRHFEGLTFGPKLPLIPCCRITIGAGIGPRDAKAIATLKQAFATEQTAFNTEKAALDGQNVAVLAMKATSDAWQARSVKAVQQASSGQAWRLRTADSILRQTLPADTSEIDQCRAAETMLRGAAR